jgi:hypothetical protein
MTRSETSRVFGPEIVSLSSQRATRAFRLTEMRGDVCPQPKKKAQSLDTVPTPLTTVATGANEVPQKRFHRPSSWRFGWREFISSPAKRILMNILLMPPTQLFFDFLKCNVTILSQFSLLRSTVSLEKRYFKRKAPIMDLIYLAWFSSGRPEYAPQRRQEEDWFLKELRCYPTGLSRMDNSPRI